MGKKWYSVEMANPEMNEPRVYRNWIDRFWRSDEAGVMIFHRENGQEIRISKRWIIKLVAL